MYYEPTGTHPAVQVDDAGVVGRIPAIEDWPVDDHCPPDDDSDPLGPGDSLLAIPKRRLTPPRRRPESHVAHDRARRSPSPVVELVLYTSAASPRSVRALRAVQEILSRFDSNQVRFEIVDLSGNPPGGDGDAVVFTPTLVKRGPGPRTYIVGNLDDPNLVVDLLELHGVRPRNDGRV